MSAASAQKVRLLSSTPFFIPRGAEESIFVMSSEVETSLDISAELIERIRAVWFHVRKIRNSKSFLDSARNDKDRSSDFSEDRCRCTLARARFAQLRGNFVEFGNHLLAFHRIIEQTQNCFREIRRLGAMLNELWNNLFIGEQVRHAEILYFHQKPSGEIRRPGNFVDKRERHPKIRRFQCRASRSNNSDVSALHDFSSLTDLDVKHSARLRFLVTPHPPLSPRRGERIKVKRRERFIQDLFHFLSELIGRGRDFEMQIWFRSTELS